MFAFKRAVIGDEISQDPEAALAVAAEFRLDGMELRSAWGRDPHELSLSEVIRLRGAVKRAGLAVPCVSGPLFKCRFGEEYAKHLDMLKRTMDVAHELGAGLVGGFTFWEEGSFARNLPAIADKLAATAPLLAEGGLVLALEPAPATSANTSARLARILAAIDSPRIRALWNPGNDLFAPGAGSPFPQGYEALQPYLAHVHAKDATLIKGLPEACRLGGGLVGYDQVFLRLAGDGYRGWVSLETQYRLARRSLGELMSLTKGDAYSLDGEEATRESLAAWDEMLRFHQFYPVRHEHVRPAAD